MSEASLLKRSRLSIVATVSFLFTCNTRAGPFFPRILGSENCSRIMHENSQGMILVFTCYRGVILIFCIFGLISPTHCLGHFSHSWLLAHVPFYSLIYARSPDSQLQWEICHKTLNINPSVKVYGRSHKFIYVRMSPTFPGVLRAINWPNILDFKAASPTKTSLGIDAAKFAELLNVYGTFPSVLGLWILGNGFAASVA